VPQSSKVPVSRYPVPTLDSMPEDIRARILKVQEKSGFVPNVFLMLAYRPDGSTGIGWPPRLRPQSHRCPRCDPPYPSQKPADRRSSRHDNEPCSILR
jgi:hypothetical protein